MNTVTEITADTHPDVFARITRLDTPPASLWAVGNVGLLSDSAPRDWDVAEYEFALLARD